MARTKTSTKRVGKKSASPKQASQSAETTESAEKPTYDNTTAVDGSGNAIKLDDEGRMTALPTLPVKGEPRPKRKNFASRALYLDYRAAECDARAASYVESAADYRVQAEEARTGGDPTAKKLRKAKKLRDQLAALEAQLEAEGIEV